MLLQKLHSAYSDFSDYCQGKPFELAISYDEICSRLLKFNEINAELIKEEFNYLFDDLKFEIQYYKIEKPEFQKFGMYYDMIYQIELKKRPLEIRYYRKQLKRIDKEFSEIEPYFIYYRSNSSEKDDQYFRKSSSQNHITALVKANEMLVEYLAQKSGGKTADEIIASSPKVKFKLKQNEVMEIAKGMEGIGVAEGAIKDIAEYLGRCYGVDIKNVYGKSYVVSNRLKPARFLERMVDFLKKSV
ncbi:MAG: RteC domain-containing protein [Saprospiraceae bacterium]|nr:RteC domain-containing protein [Saprospiraceae bacterium]